ncbi:MAG TPA: hypothetical protein VFU02_04335 [Polyangiaceae bacterium]|nr:hypothetical protein [Polyangiaceae bacterium]
MRRSAWLLVGVCALGVALGWWLMGVLAVSENDRPPLIPRIQSLPALPELPSLATGRRDPIDTLESPGGPVWLLLGPDPARADSLPLVCGFPRGTNGAIRAPECSAVAPELRPHFRSARFAVGGQTPLMLRPAPDAPHGVVALNARSGEPVPIDARPEGISARAERGTRLVRSFRLDAQKRLVQTSPTEASYTGPVSGYAATRTPAVLASDATANASSCVTPAGYVQAREELPGAGALRSDRAVHVAFYSRGDAIAQTKSRLPNSPVFTAPFACDATHGLFTWLNRGGDLSELSCSPESCVPTNVKQSDVDAENVLALGRAGSSVVLIWRDARGQPLVRLGPIASFAHSPTAPLWKPASPDWQLVKVVSAGQSLLILIQGQTLKAIQIHADGKLEALAPQSVAG